eukprot:SAG11_NODE_2610_length_3173_cov_2.271308_1_plen_117_part_00
MGAQQWEIQGEFWRRKKAAQPRIVPWYKKVFGAKEDEEVKAQTARDAERRRLAKLRPPPKPLTPDELAFVRLKIRAQRLLADLCAGFSSEDAPLPAAGRAPPSLLSFMVAHKAEHC